MATAFEIIGTTTITSGTQSSITFNNIPTTYKDLKILVSARSDANGPYDPLLYRFNSSTGSYKSRFVLSNGSAAGSGTLTTAISAAAGGTWGRINDGGVPTQLQTVSTFGSTEFYIPSYRSSVNKGFNLDTAQESNAASPTSIYIELFAGVWEDTPAITRVDLALKDGSFAQYTTATLYGIKNT